MVVSSQQAMPRGTVTFLNLQDELQGGVKVAVREDIAERVPRFICSVSECYGNGYYLCLECGKDFCRKHIAGHTGASRGYSCPEAERDPCFCGRIASVQVKCGRVYHRCAVAIFERVYAPSGKRLGF